jgi:hypothetical protein
MVRRTTRDMTSHLGSSRYTTRSQRASSSGRASGYWYSVTHLCCSARAATSARNSGRTVQPGPWCSESISVCEAPIAAAIRPGLTGTTGAADHHPSRPAR